MKATARGHGSIIKIGVCGHEQKGMNECRATEEGGEAQARPTKEPKSGKKYSTTKTNPRSPRKKSNKRGYTSFSGSR
jgi:hypothetical protein